MKKYLIVLLIASCAFGKIKAQDSLYVYDVTGIIQRDQIAALDSGNVFQQPLGFKYDVIFKVSNIGTTDRVFVNLGSSQYTADIVSITANTVAGQGGFSLTYNGTSSPVYNNSCSLLFSLTKNQLDLLKWISVQAKSKSGNLTGIKYYKINN